MDNIFEWIVAIFIIISFLSSLFKTKPAKNQPGRSNLPFPLPQREADPAQRETSPEATNYDTFPSYEESYKSEKPEAVSSPTNTDTYETANYRFGGPIVADPGKVSAEKSDSLPAQPGITLQLEARNELLLDLGERFKSRDEVRVALIMSELLAKPRSIRKR